MTDNNNALSPVDVEEPHKRAPHEEEAPEQMDEPLPHREAYQGGEPFDDADARYRYRNKDPAKRDAPVLLSWRIGLFLLTSTWVQNLSYVLTSVTTSKSYLWSTAQNQKFSSLVYTMVYLGPVFGFSMDIFRVFGERYRPSIIVGCVVNLVVCFIVFGQTTAIQNSFYGSLILSWVMEVAVMYIYTPMNVVSIRYGNRCFYNSLSYEYDRLNEKLGYKNEKKSIEESARIRNVESTARVGTIMAQVMVWRTLGSFLYTIFSQFATGRNTLKPHMKPRWFVFMAGVGSAILILQVLFLMKRKYFLDYNANDAKRPICNKIVHDALKVKRASMGRTHKPIGTNFMFVVTFIFIYFMLPDTLYNTRFSANSFQSATFGARWRQSNAILSSLGSLLGAIAYALWMILAYVFENRRHRRRLQAMLHQTQQLKGRRASSANEPTGDGSSHHDSDSDEEVDHEDSLRLVDKPYFYSPWQAGTVVIVFAGCFVWAFGCFFHMIGEMGRHNSHFNFHVFLLFETIVVNACIRFAFMPTLSLLAIHCPFDYEAASFSLFSVSTFAGGVVSALVTQSLGTAFGCVFDKWGSLATLSKYWKLCLICIFFQFLPMLLAPTLPKCRKDIRMNVENVGDWKIEEDGRAVNCTRDVTIVLREEPQQEVALREHGSHQDASSAKKQKQEEEE